MFKKISKHIERYHKEIATIFALLALLFTPFLGRAVASIESRGTIMDRLSPEHEDTRKEELSKIFVQEFFAEIRPDIILDDNAWQRIESGDLSWFMWGDPSLNMPTLLVRRQMFLDIYLDVAALVRDVESAGESNVLLSSASNASMADSPVDNLLVLEQNEEIYKKMSEILDKDISILGMAKTIAFFKYAFMPKIQSSAPYITLCPAYQPPGVPSYPEITAGIDLDALLLEGLIGEYGGYLQTYSDLAEGYKEKGEQLAQDLEDFENMEFEPGGIKEELAEQVRKYKAQFGDEITVEELMAQKDSYDLSFRDGSTDFAELTGDKEELKGFSADVEDVTEVEHTEDISRKEECGGPTCKFVTRVQDNIAGTMSQTRDYLGRIIWQIQEKVKVNAA